MTEGLHSGVWDSEIQSQSFQRSVPVAPSQILPSRLGTLSQLEPLAAGPDIEDSRGGSVGDASCSAVLAMFAGNLSVCLQPPFPGLMYSVNPAAAVH